MKKIIFIFLILFTNNIFAAPKEIIIIRHADKWEQKNPGPFLSPKGQLRAEKFVSYYLSHFKKPDFIFASNPVTNAADLDTGHSYRPIQTVMPLANQLAFQNPNGYPINANYADNQYAELAKSLLTNPQYNNKIILICWHHGLADALATSLGVTQQLKKWHGDDFDQVFVLKYNHDGKLAHFQILKKQYPVHRNPTWAELARS
ncbi:MAG TPA: histidine phosphatase family protein [Coxiellaceae bacterium]|nr:MAG: hypothetical protein A3E81_00040 [Gammaproteobacteria bacterium RIFCSPHIGHO2_12_FULL_36_30]HLB55705.1 histidine phosphatase family protein [Coxiellaceae bacterium]